MARPTPLSGFPEWLPADRIVEQHVLDVLRSTFELHGFAGIETRAVEPLDQLLRKGETSKEVYVLRRLQEEADAPASRRDGAGLGLHFDLTVPLARYVLENAGRLTFPFMRHQIQKVWRGERPQDGRFREFVQADIDVVAQGELPYHYEVELPLVIAEAFAALAAVGVPPVRILVNNRRVLQGFAEGLGLSDIDSVLRVLDKLDKIGPAAVAEQLGAEAGADARQASALLELAAVRGQDERVVDAVRELARTHGAAGEPDGLLETGLRELGQLLRSAALRAPGTIVADLKIARGLDYYTGSVYETVLVGHEDLGSICSGGRYDALASDGSMTYPGVGLSVGVSRLVARLLSAGLVTATRSVPSAVLVAVTAEETRPASDAVAAALRARGVPVEVAPSAAKFGKQIKIADRKGVPFVWFPAEPERPGPDGELRPATDHQVKDIRSGEQVAADPQTWLPPEADLRPRVVPATPA